MTPEQERLTLEILSKLDTFFTLDGIRQCQYCGGHSHEEDCIVRSIRQLKRTIEQEQKEQSIQTGEATEVEPSCLKELSEVEWKKLMYGDWIE